MKISEVITKLQEALIEVGDVEFIVSTLVDGHFCNEFGRNVEIIGLGDDDNDQEWCVAVMNFDDSEVTE